MYAPLILACHRVRHPRRRVRHPPLVAPLPRPRRTRPAGPGPRPRPRLLLRRRLRPVRAAALALCLRRIGGGAVLVAVLRKDQRPRHGRRRFERSAAPLEPRQAAEAHGLGPTTPAVAAIPLPAAGCGHGRPKAEAAHHVAATRHAAARGAPAAAAINSVVCRWHAARAVLLLPGVRRERGRRPRRHPSMPHALHGHRAAGAGCCAAA